MIRRISQLLILLFMACEVHARVQPPGWLTHAVSTAPAMNYGDASHAVLFNETLYELAPNGTQSVRTRRVIRILKQEGKAHAVAHVAYESGSDKVKLLQAWHLPATGKPEFYGKKEIFDTTAGQDTRDLYQESRLQKIIAQRDVAAGSVFGFESIVEIKTIFSQQIASFHEKAPVGKSVVAFRLPAGWEVNARLFNSTHIETSVDAGTRYWTLRNLPAIADDAQNAAPRDYLPWIAFDLVLPAKDKTASGLQTFSSWQEVSEFLASRYDPPAIPDKTIKAKADEIVASTGKSQTGIIASLCRYVQATHYLSISIDVQKAGGMTPRPAARVLACNYGDCKDKATLLRSLLSTQGIASYPVVVYSGAPTYVKPGWISVLQFNHCVLAIAVDETVENPAVINHPALGRLLIFDPTNQDTPVGLLAGGNLEGMGLVVAKERGSLVQMPTFDMRENHYDRVIKARIHADGTLDGMIQETSSGYASASERRLSRTTTTSDYRTKVIERWIQETLPLATVHRSHLHTRRLFFESSLRTSHAKYPADLQTSDDPAP
jgi:hypothetical protein